MAKLHPLVLGVLFVHAVACDKNEGAPVRADAEKVSSLHEHLTSEIVDAAKAADLPEPYILTGLPTSFDVAALQDSLAAKGMKKQLTAGTPSDGKLGKNTFINVQSHSNNETQLRIVWGIRAGYVVILTGRGDKISRAVTHKH